LEKGRRIGPVERHETVVLAGLVATKGDAARLGSSPPTAMLGVSQPLNVKGTGREQCLVELRRR
jgi:hypothetical protein